MQQARSRFYPSITISGSGAFTNNNGLVNPGKLLLSAVGSLVQPIFQHGQIVAGLRVAKMQYEQKYNTWQNTVLKAGNEVSNALVSYNSSAEKGALDAKRVAVLKKNVEDTRKLMASSSNTTYLEVISAQSNLILKEAGMPVVHDPASKSMLVEMAELKDRIGPTAEYALRPIVKRSQVNRWAMENLV